MGQVNVNRNFSLVQNEMGTGCIKQAWFFYSPGYMIFVFPGLTLDENTKDSVGSDNYSGASGNLNEDSNLSFPGQAHDENSNDVDMKLGEFLLGKSL